MKNYLKRTLLLGIAEAAFLLLFLRLLSETNHYYMYLQPWYRGLMEYNPGHYHFLLYTTIGMAIIMIIEFIVFIKLEISPHKNLADPNSRPQMWDKISLYVLLTLSSIGLPSIWMAIRSILYPALWDFSFLLFGPIALIYFLIAALILTRLFNRR